jgi:ketosteroid isomerase-like protein
MRFSIFFYLTIFAFIFLGCSQTEKPGTAETEAIKPEIFQEIMTESATAWNKGDLNGHLAIYDSSATFMSANGLVGLPALKENFQQKYFNGSKPNQQLGFEELKVKPLGAAHALVTGKFRLTGGGQAERSGRFTLVFGKINGVWKVLHDHSS